MREENNANEKINLPLVGSIVDVNGLGRVYCSRAENGTLAFLGRKEDGSIERYEVCNEKIRQDGRKYIFEEIARRKNINYGDGDYFRLDKKLRSAKL